MIDAANRLLRHVPTWSVYIAMVVWFAWLFWLAATGQMGAEPIHELELELGELAIQTFILVLAITPLRRFLGLNLTRFRRALGLAVFFFVSMHLGVWLFLDVGILSEVWKDIVKRPYITAGMLAFVLMIPLAVTSNNRSIRKLGPQAWNKLHRLTYATVVLAAIHNVMVQKVWEAEALIYLSIIVVLLLSRVRLLRFRALA